MGVTRVWLIRHGQPHEQGRQRCYGSLDVGLSEIGRSQMAQVAEHLKAEPMAAIYTSPRSRAVESARILAAAADRPVEIAADFHEIDFGDFEGLTYDEIAGQFPGLFRQWMETPTEVQFPNGECFAQMRLRVLRSFHTILSKWNGQTIAIVSHGGVNRILIAWALRMPDNAIFRLAQDHSAMNLIELVDGFPSVKSMNHTLCRRIDICPSFDGFVS
jgi:alpha-ribazole phosphatase/probable phosphoglycerate mutase